MFQKALDTCTDVQYFGIESIIIIKESRNADRTKPGLENYPWNFRASFDPAVSVPGRTQLRQRKFREKDGCRHGSKRSPSAAAGGPLSGMRRTDGADRVLLYLLGLRLGCVRITFEKGA
jgi:hypothetical protein